jgi:DNA-binding FadR family transcriptional regulator
MEASIALTEERARAGDLQGRRVQLLDFYQLLAQATRNEVMVILVSVVTDLVLKLMAEYDVSPRSTTIQTHRRIVRCLRRRAADEAVELMAGHLDKMHAYFRKSALAARSRTGT